MKLISIIIPVYNHADSLRRSVESILAQTYRPLEIVVIDDGSTDELEKVLLEIVTLANQKQIDIKVIHQKNCGAPAARNKGFIESKGEYVIFWDADTIGKPEMLLKMVEALEQHPEASYVYSGFKFGWKNFRGCVFSEDNLRENNYIDTTSLLRREDFIPFDETLKRFQDWDLWLNLLEKNKIGFFIPEILYKKIVSGRIGISQWLPSFVYRLPWKTKAVKAYDRAREIILKKHRFI